MEFFLFLLLSEFTDHVILNGITRWKRRLVVKHKGLK